MRHPKHRTTIYTVVRIYKEQITAVLDSFRTFERATEMCGVYKQQTKQLGFDFEFQIFASTYYDE